MTLIVSPEVLVSPAHGKSNTSPEIMPQIFFPNLTFEHELESDGRTLSSIASRAAAELAPVLGLLSATGQGGVSASTDADLVIVKLDQIPAGLPPSLSGVRFESLEALPLLNLEHYSFQPWGWSPAAITVGQQLRPDLEFPDSAVVRLINSRRFHAEFDHRIPLGLSKSVNEIPAGVLCTTIVEVTAALDGFAAQRFNRWVIKSNFSHAARNRLLGQEKALDHVQRAWLTKKFDAGEPVYAEPWYECIAECGLQFTIPQPSSEESAVRFEGASEMLTTSAGRYKGSVIRQHAEHSWWKAAVETCQKIADQAQMLGFFGPIGMDCMLIRMPGSEQLWLRPCHDINGRLTMGRLAISLRRWLQPGETGFWCHTFPESGSSRQNVFECLNVENVRIVSTSPAMVGAHSTNLQTALLISDDCEQLLQVARKILSQDIRGPITDIQYQ